MTSTILLVLILLGLALILMMGEILRADLIALMLAVALALTGIITIQEAFSGLSRPAVITILAIFILTQGLYKTGITNRVGQLIQRLAGGRPLRLLLVAMVSGAGLSLFMNNIAAAAVLMPALMDVSRRTRISPSKLLMPLAFSVNLGGMATLLATTNLLASATMQDLGYAPFGLLDFLPVGLPLMIVGTLYMLVVGYRLLPAQGPTVQFGPSEKTQEQLTETYGLEERVSEVHITADSPLVGKTIAQSQIGKRFGVSILAICPAGEQACLTPTPHRALRAGDKLLVTGRRERVKQLTQLGAEVVSNGAWEQELATSKINLVEVILAPRSAAEGQTLKEIRFREKYGVSVVALWRGGRPYRTDVGDRELRFGDALLVYGTPADFNVLRTDPDFLLLTELEERPARRCNEWLAAGTMILALAATGLNILPIAEAMMLGALFMIVTGCLNLDEAYRAVEWRVIFLIAGMLAASIAVTRSGAADWLANVLVGGLANWGVLVLMGGSLLLGALLAQVMSGQVAVVILIPIVISAAQQLGANPRAIAVAVAMGCNMTFLSPTSHPANVFVMGPGGYSFRDFLKVGAPLTLLLITTVLVLLPAFWPLR